MFNRKHSAAAAVQDELTRLLDDTMELTRSAAGLDTDKLDEIKDGIRERAEALGATVRNAAHSVADQAEEAIETADRYAHEKPWHLIAAAALVGLAFGVLVSRR
ncbi:MAG TPA: hypothetical protein VMK82_00225 [Steroidobacteraceae bacterium]|nr:hypothetical protein [Steroidobacteraceae bacterium]